MRTSLRVFTAAVSTLLLGALITVLPFATPASAVNGIHTINISSRNCAEGSNPCNVDVTLQGGVNFGPTITATIKSVDGSARAGADYVTVNQNVSWAGGESGTKTVPVVVNQDTSKEPAEDFTLTVTSPVQAAAGTNGTITIPNDDGTPVPTLSISGPAPAAEGNTDGTRTVDVTVTNPTNQEMNVNYATSDGSATSDTAKGAKDYTPTSGKLHWASGDGSVQHIDIPIKGDTIAEPDETFNLNFGSPDNVAIPGGQNPTVITLTNDDAGTVPAFTIDAIQDKSEGDTSQTTQTINVTLSAAASQITTVDYTTSDGTAVASAGDTKGDYELTKGTLTFPQGTTTKNFTVPINGDSVDEPDETYHVTLSNPANANLGDPATRDAKILNDDFGQVTTVPGTGGGPHVRAFGATGAELAGFMAIPKDNNGNDFTGGLHVARGDFFKADGTVGSDGIDEIVVAAGRFPPSSGTRTLPFVRIFAIDGRQLASFFAYDQGFSGGVYVAAGNLDGDTSNGDELVTGAGPSGGPHVRIWRVNSQGNTNAVVPIGGFFAYASGFSGGVRVALGNETGDTKDEIVTAPGPGGGPHVRVWSMNPDGSGNPIGGGFMAYDPGFTGGVFVAAGTSKIVTGAGAGGGPHVRVFDGNGVAQGGGFFAYDPGFTGGVTVAYGNLDHDLAGEIVTGAGPGGGPHVKVFAQDGSMPFGGGFFAYDPAFTGGVEVAVSQGANP